MDFKEKPQPVPRVEEIARQIANSIIGPLLHAANNGKKISLNFLDEVALETEAILRRYFPPASQTENTLFQKVITFLESCRDKAKAECGIYLTANHFETILESLKLATPASTAREPKEKNDN